MKGKGTRARYRAAAAAAFLLSLASCTQPTSFQPGRNGLDGYTVTQIETDRFRLSFNGNALTPRQTVDNDLIFLAARVTLKNGGDWFLMRRDPADKSTAYPTFLAPGNYTGGGNLTPPTYMPGGLQTDFSAPQESWTDMATILIHKGSKPAGEPDAYDAHDVEAHLAPLIRRGGLDGPF